MIKIKPHYVLFIGFILIWGVTFLFLQPLQQLFFGNQGDELFILAQLTNYMDGHLLSDFYYHNLPPFYPPLYFWATGLVSSAVVTTAVQAMKIGILLFALPVLFIGSYVLSSYLFKNSKGVLSNPWFWTLTPFLYFAWIDFPELITKPYEVVPALLNVLLVGWLVHFFIRTQDRTQTKKMIIVAIIAGLSFLSYYFWWLILVPLLIVVSIGSSMVHKSAQPFQGLVVLGVIMTLVASPFIVPFVVSLFQHGMENWQARHLVLSDFNLWIPFAEFSVHGLLALLGCVACIMYRKHSFIQAQIGIVIFSYLHQFLNYISFTYGGPTGQPSKPFLFLAGASLVVSASYLIIDFTLKKKWDGIVIGLFLSLLIMIPFVQFLNSPHTQERYAQAQQPAEHKELAQIISSKVHDYEERTWLSSGVPQVHNYITLNYYIAHNIHFSHQASLYSQRLEAIQNLESFEELGIDALLLYKDPTTLSYPLFFWVDNFPNGGKTLRVELSPDLITHEWNMIYSNKEFEIWLR